jgi:hypothetical protein
MAARSAGAEGEKSAGMAGVAPLVFGSKGAAEQTRSRETALRVRRAVSHAHPLCRGSQSDLRFAEWQLDLRGAACVGSQAKEKTPLQSGPFCLFK